MAVDVAFTRAGARTADVTVVIDVLRATSTITEALAAGYERVLCVDSLDGALALRRPGRVLAGERHCLRPPGFDLGNSPADTAPPRGAELVLATTNGAPAIVAAAALSPTVLIACLRNLAAIAAAISGADVLVLCAGTDGHPSLEDTYVAGRLVDLIAAAPTDTALIARAVSRAYPAMEALSAGAGGRALTDVDLDADIAFCARESVVSIAGAVTAVSGGAATVEVIC